jgi:hypothetical protein
LIILSKLIHTYFNISTKSLVLILQNRKNYIVAISYCFRVDGTVDRIPFSTKNILINGLDQTVTGQKTFITADRRNAPTLTTNYLNIEGLLNEMDFKYMCSRIVSSLYIHY